MRALPSLRQLRAFVAIYQTGSISAAAEQLALTQPAVTVLLRELESKLGLTLFDRSTRTLRRTEAAAEAIAFAERALAELEAMGNSMADLAEVRRGRVRIACTSTIAQTVLPPLMRRFLDANPAVQLEINEVAPSAFVDTLQTGRTDMGIGTLESPVPGLREDVFMRDTLSALALPAPDFPADRPITWKQLAALPLVTVRHGYGVRHRIDDAAREAGVQLRIAHEVSLLTTAVALAASGLGVAVVPGSLLAHAGASGLVARRLTRPTVERNMSVVYRQDRTLPPAAAAFRTLVIDGHSEVE